MTKMDFVRAIDAIEASNGVYRLAKDEFICWVMNDLGYLGRQGAGQARVNWSNDRVTAFYLSANRQVLSLGLRYCRTESAHDQLRVELAELIRGVHTLLRRCFPDVRLPEIDMDDRWADSARSRATGIRCSPSRRDRSE